MMFTGEKKVPALLRAKVNAEDQMTMSMTKGIKSGFMVKNEFNSDLGAITVKVFSNESAAKSYAQGQEIIKVDVTWVP